MSIVEPTAKVTCKKLPVERALWVQWNTETHSFGFRSGTLKAETPGGVLSFVASVYDPLGLVAPIILPAKYILQGLCRRNHGWDEDLPPETCAEWQVWQSKFKSLTTTDGDT